MTLTFTEIAGKAQLSLGSATSDAPDMGVCVSPFSAGFCGFSGTEATPQRTAFVRFRKELVAHKMDRLPFMAVTVHLKSKTITIKTGTPVDATIIASASAGDARWVKQNQQSHIRKQFNDSNLNSPAHRSHDTSFG